MMLRMVKLRSSEKDLNKNLNKVKKPPARAGGFLSC